MDEELKPCPTCEKNETRRFQSPVFALLSENADKKTIQDFAKKFEGKRLIDGIKSDFAVKEQKRIKSSITTFQLSDEQKTMKQLQAFNEASFANIATMSAADMLEYQSPITVIASEIRQEFEDNVFKAVQRMDIKVDKDELVKALEYDRNQYEKGYRCAEEKFGRYARWNDCNENLPANGQKVLLQTTAGAILLGCYDGVLGVWITDCVSEEVFTSDQSQAISHWAEIPPIEQEDKDECNNT